MSEPGRSDRNPSLQREELGSEVVIKKKTGAWTIHRKLKKVIPVLNTGARQDLLVKRQNRARVEVHISDG